VSDRTVDEDCLAQQVRGERPWWLDLGMFGFKDSWLAPYAWTTLYEEIAGGVLLLAAAGVLCFSGKTGR